MKKHLLIFTLICALSASARPARAQDATSVPLQPSPTPHSETSPGPAASAPKAPRATPVAAATPSSKPTRTKADTSPAKKSSPEKTAKSGAIDNYSSGKNGGGIVRRLEAQWQKAIKDHDTSFVQNIIARDFIGVSSSGKVGDKATMLYDAKRDRNSYQSVSSRNLSIHVFGPHVVVAIGVMTEAGTTSGQHRFTYSYRFSDTWMDRDGKWECVAAHSTAIKLK